MPKLLSMLPPKIIVLLSLVFFLIFGYAFPSFAQSALEKEQSSISYVPKQANVKDEQNIEFLDDLTNLVAEKSNFSEVLPVEQTGKMPVGRKAIAEYYYSPEAFDVRESMKLYRALTCKASWISRVRGVDLVNTLLKSEKENNYSNYELEVKLVKKAYEHFCPNLW